VQLLQSSFFIGILLGSILNGFISDRYGRRTIFIIIPPLLFVILLLSASTNTLWIYGICLIVKGICVASIYQSAFVVGIEFLGGRWRFWLGNIFSIIFAIGGVYICLLAEYLRDWRYNEIAVLLLAIAMLSYTW